MSDTATSDMEPAADPPKSGKKGLLIGLILAFVAAGGGFYAVSSGLILQQDSGPDDAAHSALPDDSAHMDTVSPDDIAFVQVEPITISLGSVTGAQHLRFRGELEVPPDEASNVERLLPRIVDVLNGYLRAVEPSTLRQPDILQRLRAQMLRRVRLVVGEGRVNDLLIMEFVLK